jgi:hypothetical protein
MLSGESTVAGAVQTRSHPQSFGARVLDLVSDAAGEHSPQLSANTREHVAGLIDAGMSQTLEFAQKMAASGAVATRAVIRALGIGVVVLAFAVVGVLLWSLGARLGKTEDAVAHTLAQVDDNRDANLEAKEHRERLDENVKLLAAHAVALTASLNKTSRSNYELLEVIVDKLDARGDVPKLHERPVDLESPITLRVIAGEH